MLVLSVQFDEARRQLAQGRRRRERTVDESPAAALRGDLAADEELFSATFEDSFDRRGFLPRSHQLSGCPTAQEQPHGLGQARLSGAGLACQHVETGVELYLRPIDDREMGNAQEAKHGGSRKDGNSNRNIALTAISLHDTVLQIQSRAPHPVNKRRESHTGERCPSGARTSILRTPVCVLPEVLALPCCWRASVACYLQTQERRFSKFSPTRARFPKSCCSSWRSIPSGRGESSCTSGGCSAGRGARQPVFSRSSGG